VRKPYEVAVVVSDLHLTLKPPVGRSEEKDWLGVQANYLTQLGNLALVGSMLPIPILIAGDIFDRWNAPAELINFVIAHMPKYTWAIPGQHDLPHHNYDEITKSAYWTLVEAGCIYNIPPHQPVNTHTSLRVHGFPWGCKLTPLTKPHMTLFWRLPSYISISGQKVTTSRVPPSPVMLQE
jgi:hypothetical protein